MTMPHKYRPYTTVDLPDRTWPERVARPRADLVLDRPARRQPGARQPDGHRRASALLRAAPRARLKEIEVGFPAASKTDFDFVRLLVEEELDPRRHDDRGADAGAARADRAHLRGDRGRASARSSTSTTRRRRRSGASSSASTGTGSPTSRCAGRALCKELAAQTATRDRLPVLARELPRHRARLRARDLRGGRGRVGADARREDDRQPADDGRGSSRRTSTPTGSSGSGAHFSQRDSSDPLASTRTTTAAPPSRPPSSA